MSGGGAEAEATTTPVASCACSAEPVASSPVLHAGASTRIPSSTLRWPWSCGRCVCLCSRSLTFAAAAIEWPAGALGLPSRANEVATESRRSARVREAALLGGVCGSPRALSLADVSSSVGGEQPLSWPPCRSPRPTPVRPVERARRWGLRQRRGTAAERVGLRRRVGDSDPRVTRPRRRRCVGGTPGDGGEAARCVCRRGEADRRSARRLRSRRRRRRGGRARRRRGLHSRSPATPSERAVGGAAAGWN